MNGFNPTRGFLQNLSFISELWADRVQDQSAPNLTIIEKLVGTVVLICRLLSFSNLFALIIKKEKNWSNFLDLYIFVWLVASIVILLNWNYNQWLTLGFAVYTIIIIVTNQLAVILVDTRMPGWKQPSIRRTMLLTILNFATIIVCFAIVYLDCGCIGETVQIDQIPYGTKTVLLASADQFLYFSFVTVSTLGYGDYLPINATGRYLVVAELSVFVLYVIAIFPVILGSLSGFYSYEQTRDQFNMEE